MGIRRSRNPRGQGSRLRHEILAAARVLVEEQGEQAVTLRSVASQVGIAAPSIYAHFPDREAIFDALIDEAFGELTTMVAAAMDCQAEPVKRLRAACAAYLDFAMLRPNRYQLAFAARQTNVTPRPAASIAFELLVNAIRGCVHTGESASIDPFGDATAIWVALHGYATLHASRPAFAWPPTDATLHRIVDALAALQPIPQHQRTPPDGVP
jgi:AcrR family transcriptional regulator